MARLLALLALTAILFGALIAGSPVNGDDSHAARTAGINLTTPPSARTTSAAVVVVVALGLLIAVALASVSTAGVSIVRPRDAARRRARSIDLALASARRGPPALV